jgi:hypothetical protein
MGLDTKTVWLTDRQSRCGFDFDSLVVEYSPVGKNVAEDYVKIPYQETTSEDKEDFICAAVQCREMNT